MTQTQALAINTLRALAIDIVQRANSGHPGAPMGCASLAYTLFQRHLRFDPTDPAWPNRDRFVLSNGHASALLYSLLHLTGYAVSLDDLKAFRQWGSITPGHPENHLTPGVEATTGPLGQGLAHAVGFAIAEAALAARYNGPDHALFDHFTYVLAGDGCLMEGVTAEAASLAGHLKLGKLIVLYDDNRITIDGSTDLAFTEDVQRRFDAYGWHTLRVEAGDDVEAIDAAIQAAQHATDRPSLLLIRTHIGFGSPNRQDTAKAHGSPLGEPEATLTKQNLGWPTEPTFHIPPEVSAHMAQAAARGQARRAAWLEAQARLRAQRPDLADELDRRLSRALPADWAASLPTFPASASGMATRAASGKVLDALHALLPDLIGGSADLAESVKVPVGRSVGDFSAENRLGKNLFFGVREHAMGAICNGLALYGGFRPYGGTFLVFSDYMRPSVRLGALEHAPAIWIWTHDSIGLGEDGPTHQPIEHLAALRAIPDLHIIRPADANETTEAWVAALQSTRPVGLILTRQNVPTLDRAVCAPAAGLHRGGYVLLDAPDGAAPAAILMASGSEVSIALAAQATLAAQGIPTRVVSMPCTTLFDAQPKAYRDSVLPPSVRRRVSIEAAVTLGWERYVGLDGELIGLDRFGASAPAEVLYAELGVTAARAVEAVQRLVASP
jgi:transketolase